MEMRSSEVPDEGLSLSWLRRVEWAHEMGEVNEFVKVKDSVWLKVEDSAWYSISVPFEVRFQCSQFKQQRILTSYTASFAMRSLIVGVFVAISLSCSRGEYVCLRQMLFGRVVPWKC